MDKNDVESRACVRAGERNRGKKLNTGKKEQLPMMSSVYHLTSCRVINIKSTFSPRFFLLHAHKNTLTRLNPIIHVLLSSSQKKLHLSRAQFITTRTNILFTSFLSVLFIHTNLHYFIVSEGSAREQRNNKKNVIQHVRNRFLLFVSSAFDENPRVTGF